MELHQLIIDRDSQIEAIQMRMLEYKARQAKNQEIVVLQKYHENYLENKVQTMVSLSLQKAMKEQRVPIYQYVDSIAIEDARPDCC